MSERMEPLQETVKRALPEAYLVIAAKGCPEGTEAKCVVCGVQRHVSTSELAKWIEEGFPKHCQKSVTISLRPEDGLGRQWAI